MALWWLLRAGVARVGLVGVPCPCGAMRTFGAFGGFWRVWLGLLGYLVPAELCELLERLEGFGAFGGFEAWQTAALNAYKKPLLRPAMAQGHRHCCGRKVPLRSYANFWSVWRVLERLEGFGGFEAWQTAALNAYKKPLLRPAMAQGHRHCCGRKVPLRLEGFGGFG